MSSRSLHLLDWGSESPPLVKIKAAIALNSIVSHPESKKYLKDYLQNILQVYLKLIELYNFKQVVSIPSTSSGISQTALVHMQFSCLFICRIFSWRCSRRISTWVRTRSTAAKWNWQPQGVSKQWLKLLNLRWNPKSGCRSNPVLWISVPSFSPMNLMTISKTWCSCSGSICRKSTKFLLPAGSTTKPWSISSSAFQQSNGVKSKTRHFPSFRKKYCLMSRQAIILSTCSLWCRCAKLFGKRL